MKDPNAVTRADMQRIDTIWPYRSPDQISLRFSYGGHLICASRKNFTRR